MKNLLHLSGAAWWNRESEATPLLVLIGNDEYSLQPAGISILPPATNLESSEMLRDFNEETKALLIPRGERVFLNTLTRIGYVEKNTKGAHISHYDVLKCVLRIMRENPVDDASFVIHEGSEMISKRTHLSLCGIKIPWFQKRKIVHRFGFYCNA